MKGHYAEVYQRFCLFNFQHLYPKSQIDIHVIVLEDAGSVLASALTCAGLALADASIHMFDTLIGASLVSRRCSMTLFKTV